MFGGSIRRTIIDKLLGQSIVFADMAGLPAYAEALSGSTLRSSTIQLGVSNVMCGTASTPQDKKREAVASEGDGNEGLTLI